VLSSQEPAYDSLLIREEDRCQLRSGGDGSTDVFADLYMYHLIHNQLTGLHKQKESGDKIKIQM